MLKDSCCVVNRIEVSFICRKGECGTRGLYKLSSRARRNLLRSSGCLDLDPEEAEANKVLRQWRRLCGCSCAGPCRPDRCECAEAGVPCQEERPGSPCACAADSCGNPAGRRRFDPTAVKMHFIQTMLEVQGALSIC
jgi:Cysteine/serine-rich nuclear protein N-terminus